MASSISYPIYLKYKLKCRRIAEERLVARYNNILQHQEMKQSSESDYKMIEAKEKPRALVVMMTMPRLCVIKNGWMSSLKY